MDWTRKAPNARADISLYIWTPIVLLAINIIGFGPTFFFAPLEASDNLDPLRILHGLIFSAWYVLLIVQALLIRAGITTLHKYLGYAGITIALALVIDGCIMTAYFARDFAPTEDIGAIIYKASGVWANFHLIGSFVIFVSLALLYRRHFYLHQRFMLLSALAMMTAAVSRVAATGIIPIHPGAQTFAGMLMLLLIPIIFEYMKFRRVHGVYIWSAVVYFITLIICAVVMPMTTFGQSVLFWF